MCGFGDVIQGMVPVIRLIAGRQNGGGGVPAPAPPPPPEAPLSEKPDKTNFGTPPGPAEMPQGVGISSTMDAAQQRAAIATHGSQAQGNVGSFWRSQPGIDYYKNVALNSLIDPATGGVMQDASLLPVEWKFLQEGLGRQTSRDTTEHFLTQLLGE